MKNKLRIIIVAILTLVGNQAFSQSLNFSGGFTTSKSIIEGLEEYMYSSTSSDGNYAQSFKNARLNGFNFSIGYEFNLGNRLSLEAGLKYQTRGFKFVESIDIVSGPEQMGYNVVTKTKFNYLDLPIVLNTAITTGDFRVYARSGIYVGLLMGGKESERAEFISSNEENEVNEDSEKLDLSDFENERLTGGLILGAGLEYKGFYFETNYNVGFLSLMNHDNVKVYSQDISFSLGYKLKFNK